MKIDKPHKSQLPALRMLWKEAFGDTEEFLNNFFSTAFSAERCRCVMIDGELAAALYWFDCLYMDKPVAYLYAVATAKQFRGQGTCRKLMEDTHRHLTQLGYEGAILVPGDVGLFRLYENMGYKTCSYIKKLCCTADNREVQIYNIDKYEYAKLRRQYLPKGGVVQENENLDFLQTQEKFYKGADFLLVAHVEKDILYGVELLGDETVGPRIVESFGCVEGEFYTPGMGKPYAMYLPLRESKLQPPCYFGLSFG